MPQHSCNSLITRQLFPSCLITQDRWLTCIFSSGPLLFDCSLSFFWFGICALPFHSCSWLRVCVGSCCRLRVSSWLVLDICSLPVSLNFCCRISLAVFQLLFSRLLSSCICNILLVLHSRLGLQLAAWACNQGGA